MTTPRLAGTFGTLCILMLVVSATLTAQKGSPTPRQPLVLAESSYFFVGGRYVTVGEGEILDGQMYVHALFPATVTQPYPIVMMHGLNQTGTNFEGTPDGREGWAQYFVRAGYKVFVIDQPARGRSAYHADQDGPLARGAFGSAVGMAQLFTAPELYNQWPQARLHTQWPGEGPGKGQKGDPAFDQFFASQVESINNGKAEILAREAGAALLDKIGPAILLTHSQAAAFGWQIADARPDRVKAILSIEPGGPLSPTVAADGSLVPAYGLTSAAPITFAPAVTENAPLNKKPQAESEAPELWRCWMQGEPVRQLPTLHGIPIAIVVAQAFRIAQTAHCLSKFLTQAGVANEFIRLENVGILGNGHMLMLEKNSDDIARFLTNWLQRNVKPAS